MKKMNPLPVPGNQNPVLVQHLCAVEDDQETWTPMDV